MWNSNQVSNSPEKCIFLQLEHYWLPFPEGEPKHNWNTTAQEKKGFVDAISCEVKKTGGKVRENIAIFLQIPSPT